MGFDRERLKFHQENQVAALRVEGIAERGGEEHQLAHPVLLAELVIGPSLSLKLVLDAVPDIY